MGTDYGETALRRYLLGELADEPAATLEQDYFAREDLFERVRAAESDLVDEYVAGGLSAHERDRFERYYLATPVHRRRLGVARELRAASRAAAPVRGPVASHVWWAAAMDALRRSPRSLTAAAVAALVLLVAGSVWILRPRPAPPAVVVTSREGPTPSRETSPSGSARDQRPDKPVAPESPGIGQSIVALVLSPLSVRGADEGPSLRIPSGIELVVLHLEGDPAAPPVARGRAVVRTVSGREIWRGPAAAEREAEPVARARVQIPAHILTPDDYIVLLFDTDGRGRDVERHRYFLRVKR